jgi:hypothetical protein
MTLAVSIDRVSSLPASLFTCIRHCCLARGSVSGPSLLQLKLVRTCTVICLPRKPPSSSTPPHQLLYCIIRFHRCVGMCGPNHYQAIQGPRCDSLTLLSHGFPPRVECLLLSSTSRTYSCCPLLPLPSFFTSHLHHNRSTPPSTITTSICPSQSTPRRERSAATLTIPPESTTATRT